MGKSGNPLKAQEDQIVEQVRAGIRQGKKPKIPLSDTTSIVIESSNEDEAEFISRLILLHEKPFTTVESLVGGMSIYVNLYAGTEHAKYVKRHIMQWLKTMKDIDAAYEEAGVKI